MDAGRSGALRDVRRPAAFGGFAKPLSAGEAARRVAFLRDESGFSFCCYELRSWPLIHAGLSTPAFPRRRTYDLVLAVTLQSNGVTEFYTRNVPEYRGAGFARVVNPIDCRLAAAGCGCLHVRESSLASSKPL